MKVSQHKRTSRGLRFKVVTGAASAALILSFLATVTTTSGASAKAAKSPINVMTIDSATGTSVLDPSIGATALVYEKYINAHGGIAGYPLHVTVCDDEGTESQAVICAQDAVNAKDVAVVSGFSLNGGDEAIPILQQAHIAWFADPEAAFPEDGTSPVSFPAYGVLPQNAGQIAIAYQTGCKSVSVLLNGGPSASVLIPDYQAAAKAYGETLNQIVQVSTTAADYSPYVAQVLQGGTDCVVTAIGTAQFASLLPPWAASGTKAVLYAGGGQLSPAAAAGYTSVVNGSYNISATPDISSKVFDTYRAALSKYHAPTSSAFNYDGTGTGAWIGYVLFTNIVQTIKGPITNASFLKAASHAKAVSSDGILPVIDFAKPWTSGPAGEERSFNCGITYQKLENGKWVQLYNRFQNANLLTEGTGKLGPQLLPTSTALACQS